MRLDLMMVKKGLAASRSKAQELIGAGLVSLDGRPAAKSSQNVGDNSVVYVQKNDEYVSRGGKKLEKALKEFIIDARDLVCADIGASTGGFCDCLLRNGARRIYAVDSGHGQLDPGIASDPAVVSLEGTNARFLSPETLGEKVELLTCDVSFISVTLLFDAFRSVLTDEGRAVILIKPQFEAGRKSGVGKNGIVRDPVLHTEIITNVLTKAREAGFFVSGLTYSPVTGGDGNIEFLALLDKKAVSEDAPDISVVVKAAHSEFYGKD